LSESERWMLRSEAEKTPAPAVADAPADPALRPPGWPAEESLTPDVLAQAVNVMIMVKSAVINFRAFPPHSELVENSMVKVHTEMLQALKHTPSLAFMRVEGTLTVNGKSLPPPRGVKKPG